VLLARAESACLPPLADAAVSMLLRAAAPLAAKPPIAEEPAPVVEEPTQLAVEASPRAKGHSPKIVNKPPRALFVGRATVLKLAQSAARPRGSFVAPSAEHPAGLRLSGVAALGIGLQDGDILIEALGITPRAPGEIVGAIIQARAQHAASLSGTLWRRGQSFGITVEQPY
ncbi:MAG TPA: hypothetical protein VEQ59_03145, partial [Polyangiaceae bacterium]|nr:hypothetical protein [Polyangiaceae bacterium]